MEMNIDPDLLRGSTRLLVLAVLAEEPLYGYQIMKEVSKQSNELLKLGTASIYPIVHSLEKKHLVKSLWKEVGGRERKYYALTPRGRKQLRVHVHEWETYTKGVNNVLRHSRLAV